MSLFGNDSDEFWVPNTTPKGNVIQYAYDADGRLSHIVDPVGRITKLKYWKSTDTNSATCSEPSVNLLTQPCTYPGLLGEVEDWRDRKVTYEYDEHGRLIATQLPAAKNPTSTEFTVPDIGTPNKRPRTSYTYQTPAEPTANEAPQSDRYTDFMLLAGNILSVTDPQENACGGAARSRVVFEYFTGTDFKDYVHYQKWPCSSWNGTACAQREATFGYAPGLFSSLTHVVDIFGQQRDYTVAEQPDKRHHITKETFLDVPVMKKGETTFPNPIGLDEPTENTDLVTSVTLYNDEGESARARGRAGWEESVEAFVRSEASVVYCAFAIEIRSSSESSSRYQPYEAGTQSGWLEWQSPAGTKRPSVHVVAWRACRMSAVAY